MALVSGTPAFQQVAEDIRKQITSGALPAGAQLPSMAQLKELYGVSSTVVRDALAELRREGLVIGQQGKGVFVRDGAEAASAAGEAGEIMERLEELTEVVRQLDARLARLEQGDAPKQPSRR
ncbi:winged helix-turn-helix domain-containing protein [Catellatospora sp. NPDC049609]|uniref:winged helix-turn-helix domain-containing protein n=1 Tax=Catellatospora sp. NPDC049609 TaxID=3155505 RepID=UPI0034325B8D